MQLGVVVIASKGEYRVAKRQLTRLQAQLDDIQIDPGGDIGPLVNAHREAVASLADELRSEIEEYEALCSGAKPMLRAESLAGLPRLLVRARLASGVSQDELARAVGLPGLDLRRRESQGYANESVALLSKIARALNIDLAGVAQVRQPSLEPDQDAAEEPEAWAKFPVRAMYKRGWFEGFQGTAAAAMSQASVLLKELRRSAGVTAPAAMLRQHVRSGGEPDQYALLAWKWRVLAKAKKVGVEQKFVRSALNAEWFASLAQLSAQDDGPQVAVEYLARSGIALVVEPSLPRTYLDGAALLAPGARPVVALTLRHDRLDNFWFVLFHELMHVVEHLRRGHLESIFDDLDADPDAIEAEADAYAAAALLPPSDWDAALPRYVHTEDAVVLFAEQMGISPAIVAGRVRNESQNYTLFNSLIGRGRVRVQFPDVIFGV